jgi:hypothetical protein
MKSRFVASITLFATLTLSISEASAAAQIPYQSAAANSCTNQSSCQMTFAAVPAAEVVALQHVSCSGMMNGFTGLYAVTLNSANQPTNFDALQNSLYAVGQSNSYMVVSTPTLYFVKAGDSPKITLVSSGEFSGTVSCLASGYGTKSK